MVDNLYEWLQNITFYLVMVTAVLHVVPNQEYRKYIRFFTGLVLVLMMLTPILNVFGTDVELAELYEESKVEELQKDIMGQGFPMEEEQIKMEEKELPEGEIKVEEIHID